MNRKGFTLIELLAIILLLSLISTIGTYAVSSYINASKIKSDEILWRNIKTAAQEYIDECTSGVSSLECKELTDSYDADKKITEDTIYIKDLAESGFLNVTSDKNKDNVEIAKVVNANGKGLNNCEITITKTIDINTYQVSYNIKTADSTKCRNFTKKDEDF